MAPAGTGPSAIPITAPLRRLVFDADGVPRYKPLDAHVDRVSSALEIL
jgi:hypothetical protein